MNLINIKKNKNQAIASPIINNNIVFSYENKFTLH